MTVFDADALDLAAYFTRIGYTGPARPELETLHELALLHPSAIPFENLDPLLRQPVPLDIPSLQQKLLHARRGGWCFEQNVLLGTALRAIGFQVTGLAARVIWNVPPGVVTPRSHMVLRIDLRGRILIVDAGFGGLTLTAPLTLDLDAEQPTPHETFRVTSGDHGYTLLQARLGNEWRSLYRFDLTPQVIPDYEVSSWYLCSHPRSHFLTTLVAARAQRDRRHTLRNTEFATHHAGGYTERRMLAGAGELRRALEQVFGITLPAGANVDALLTQIGATSVQPAGS